MKYLTFLLLSIALCSCAYQQSTHTFVYHGTDAIPSNKQFYYVAYGVTGTSSALYNVRGGGHVRDGLVADAKLDLRTNSPLQANQAYANLSIDVIRTETGIVTDGTPSISQVQLTCVVSADIIQYCDELPEKPKTRTDIIKLDQLQGSESEDTEQSSQDQLETETSTGGGSTTNGGNNWQKIIEKGDWDGKSLWYAGNMKTLDITKPELWTKCVIIDEWLDRWKIEFLNPETNKTKKKWIDKTSYQIAPRYPN